MSLFPAYTTGKESSDTQGDALKQESCDAGSWLQNPSFVPALPVAPQYREVSPDVTVVATVSARVPEQRSSHHSKKSKKHKKEKRSTKELLENNYSGKRRRSSDSDEDEKTFYIDKKKEPSFYGMVKLTGPNVPRYTRRRCRPLGKSHYLYIRSKLKRRRYYKAKPETVVETVEEERPEWQHDVQTDLKQITETLNKTVSNEPWNIAAWLQLCRLQPSLLSLSPRSGPAQLSPAERRSVCEKQISILDKGLHHNPDSGELLRERFGLASTVVPGDSLAAELRARLALQPCLLAGWLELARVERSHLASCSVPQVTSVFADAMQAVHQRRKKEPTLVVENIILDLVLACGIFLQEAGLQEQVWTLLRLYTEPSLPPCGDPTSIAELQAAANLRAAALEEEAASKEDELLSSGLPSSELWLRIERLRETAHFLPAPDCTWAREGDPQRLVYPEDLAHLAQPITEPSLALRVAVTALVVLGAPPLPFTHCAARLVSQSTSLPHLGLLATAWPLLVSDIATPAGWLGNTALHFSATSGSGPLTPGPGGQLYRSLLHTAFHRYAASLPGREGHVLLCWWLKLEALLARINPQAASVAHVRSGAKRLLKRPENRGETQMFREFALLEASLSGSTSAAEKVLLPSVQARRGAGPISTLANRASVCCVFRSLAEIWSSQGLTDKVSALLCGLAEENVNPLASKPPCDHTVSLALTKFEKVTTETLATQNADAELTILEALSEDFLEHWVACYAWLLATTETVWAAGSMLERTIGTLESCKDTFRGARQREGLYGVFLAILELRGRKHAGGAELLSRILFRALDEFPDNASLLSIRANISMPLGLRLYKPELSQQLLGNIIKVISLENRIEKQEIAEKNSSNIEVIKCQPKIIAQYERLISYHESRHCPLVWRLYLRYVGLRSNPETVKCVFYKALEDCPWVKALYLQGASLLPEELGNIQDLLVEKELRLHVAPEELEILRDH